ncbi:MAG: DUF3617 family protein [Gallionellaceae bacterium]|nr:MAG: DUF3617 family protein [Gallionellaceae bacterium]
MNKLLGAILTMLFSLTSAAAQAAPGEQWEITYKSDMPAMPDTVTTACLPKDAEKNPGQLMKQNGSCEISDMKSSGNKTTWKMRCNTGSEESTGSGEVTYKKDSFQGVIRLSGKSQGQPLDMTENYRGKRIGTACDTDNAAVATRGMENVNDMMGMANKQMASAMAEQCEISNYRTAELISGRFFGPNAACTGKEKYACKMIAKDAPRNADVYVRLAKHDDTSDVSIAQICGIDMAGATRSICKTVDSGNYQTLADYCPAEAKAFQREVADSGSAKSPNTATDIPANSVIDGAKKLKGLFGY